MKSNIIRQTFIPMAFIFYKDIGDYLNREDKLKLAI
jgi:predicted helicase